MQIAKLESLQQILQVEDRRETSNTSWRAHIDVAGSRVEVALKDLPRDQIVAELVASGIAETLPLRMPKTFLVDVSRTEARLRNGHPSGEFLWHFASEFLPLPSYSSEGRSYTEQVAIANTDTFARIILFDILVGNVDRADRNMLVDGTTLVPFDHDQALLGLGWTVETLTRQQNAPNRSMFDSNLHWTRMATREKMTHLARVWSATMGGQAARIVCEFDTYLTLRPSERHALTEFIDWRAQNLELLLEQRFKNNPPQGA